MPPEIDPTSRPPETQRERWTARAAHWRERPTAPTATSRAATDLMRAALDLRPGMRLLDIACGPGDPAVPLAHALAPVGGYVVATDLVAGMLAMAGERTTAEAITNITFAQADVAALPFVDASFAAVTCRYAVMLLPDVRGALREMHRVLVSGGMAVCLVSSPTERNAQVRPLAVARNYLSLPRPSPDEPDRFRFSGPGELAAQLRQAGFREVRESVHDLPVEWNGTVTERWAAALRNNRRIARAVAALPDTQRETLEREVLDAFRAEEARGDDATVAVIVAVGVR